MEKRWHIARWPALAWLETILKLAGMLYGFASLRLVLVSGDFALPVGPRFVQWLIMIFLSLGLVAGIFDRFQDREIIAMGFVLLNNIAHWGMVAALAGGAVRWLVPFSALFLLGDLVKIIFIYVNKFRVRGFPASVLYGLTSFYIAGYLALLILELSQ